MHQAAPLRGSGPGSVQADVARSHHEQPAQSAADQPRLRIWRAEPDGGQPLLHIWQPGESSRLEAVLRIDGKQTKRPVRHFTLFLSMLVIGCLILAAFVWWQLLT